MSQTIAPRLLSAYQEDVQADWQAMPWELAYFDLADEADMRAEVAAGDEAAAA